MQSATVWMYLCLYRFPTNTFTTLFCLPPGHPVRLAPLLLLSRLHCRVNEWINAAITPPGNAEGGKSCRFNLCTVDKVLRLPCSLRAFCVDKLSLKARTVVSCMRTRLNWSSGWFQPSSPRKYVQIGRFCTAQLMSSAKRLVTMRGSRILDISWSFDLASPSCQASSYAHVADPERVWINHCLVRN